MAMYNKGTSVGEYTRRTLSSQTCLNIGETQAFSYPPPYHMAKFLPQFLGLNMTFYQEKDEQAQEKDKIKIPCPKILKGDKKEKRQDIHF